jgi:hypothetical protein
MDVLEKLRLGCRGVTTEKNIDLSSETTSSFRLEFFADTTK